MNLDFDGDLNDLSVMILYFDLNNFTRKGIVTPKTQYILASVLFSKNVIDMKVKLDMTTRRKMIFGCFARSTCSRFSSCYP